VGDTIVLNTLRYPDEIRPTDELKIPAADSKAAQVTDKELQMAKALVEGMSEKWKPQQYHDTYREDVMALIKKKIAANQTKTLTEPEPEEEKPAKTNVIDLVALLQASLGKKPAKAAADDDDDDEPPPTRAKKPAHDDDDTDDTPPPRARKAPAHAATHAGAKRTTAAKPTTAKTATKTAAKKTAAKKTTASRAAAKPAAKAAAPARRRKAA
jgi:DNA end-binding protein Ku